MKNIPLSIPNICGNEIEYVKKALEDGWVSSAGPYVCNFEKNIADYVGSVGAVSCQNGTAAIHTALLSIDVTPADIVIVPTLTFIAAVNPVKYIGATPVFMDCDSSLCMDPDKLENYLKEECSNVDGKCIDKNIGKQVKAIVVVHVFGNMADMERIVDISKKYHIKVIEDATEAIGTYYTTGIYRGKFAGTLGDIGTYSFNGNKIITTGGGGMLVSDNEAYLERAKHLTTQAKSDELFYTHDEIGYNYRMTSIQAAIGIAQLEKLEEFIEIKNRNFKRYKELLDKIPGVKLLECRNGIRCNRWFYALYCDNDNYDRDELIRRFEEAGIQSRPIWGLIHEQLPYTGEKVWKVSEAYEYVKHVINIPCSTNLKDEEIKYVVQVLQ